MDVRWSKARPLVFAAVVRSEEASRHVSYTVLLEHRTLTRSWRELLQDECSSLWLSELGEQFRQAYRHSS